jgi:putative ABC transport system ATP-binding protein
LNRDSKKTIIVVTHDPHAAERARIILHLEKGELTDGSAVNSDSSKTDSQMASLQ